MLFLLIRKKPMTYATLVVSLVVWTLVGEVELVKYSWGCMGFGTLLLFPWLLDVNAS